MKGEEKKKSMVPNQISTSQQYFTHSFSKVLRNVIMTWAWNIYRHFHWRSWHGTGDVVNSRKTGAAKWPIMEAQACLFPQEHTKQWQQWSPYNHTCRIATSCYITVFICRGLASLYVLFVYQNFNTLLNHADTRVKPSSWLANYLQKKDIFYMLFLFTTVINATKNKQTNKTHKKQNNNNNQKTLCNYYLDVKCILFWRPARKLRNLYLAPWRRECWCQNDLQCTLRTISHIYKYWKKLKFWTELWLKVHRAHCVSRIVDLFFFSCTGFYFMINFWSFFLSLATQGNRYASV